MKASAHILGGESTIEIGQSGSMILVQDTSAAAESETQNKAAASTSRDWPIRKLFIHESLKALL